MMVKWNNREHLILVILFWNPNKILILLVFQKKVISNAKILKMKPVSIVILILLNLERRNNIKMRNIEKLSPNINN